MSPINNPQSIHTNSKASSPSQQKQTEKSSDSLSRSGSHKKYLATNHNLEENYDIYHSPHILEDLDMFSQIQQNSALQIEAIKRCGKLKI